MGILLALSNRLWSWRTAGSAPVALRPIRPDDAGALQSFVRALSPASRRLRFHAALNELSDAMLKAMTCVDQRAHVALVLTVTEGGTERIVGEARYAASGDGDTAEFGIAVADAFQGLGLAKRLVAALIDAARTNGLRWLVGEVLVGNARMLGFMRRCGFIATTRGVEPGVVRVECRVDRLRPATSRRSWRRVRDRAISTLRTNDCNGPGFERASRHSDVQRHSAEWPAWDDCRTPTP
jgi:acetyltransferase